MRSVVNQVLVFIAVTGFVLPFDMAVQAASRPENRQNDVPSIHDVALTDTGFLIGQLVDESGTAVESRQVQLLSASEGKLIDKTLSDSDGRFTLKSARGGVYRVVSKERGVVVRAWQPQTAPPAAKSAVLVVTESHVARGQLAPSMGLLPVVAGIGLVGIIIGVANKSDGGHGGFGASAS